MYNIRSLKPKFRLTLPPHVYASKCQFTPDGTHLILTCSDGQVRLINMVSHNLLLSIPVDASQQAELITLSCAPRKNRVAIGLGNGDLKILDLNTMTINHTFTGAHQEAIKGCAYSPCGNFLATGGNAPSLRIWDLRTNQLVYTGFGGPGVMDGLNFFPGQTNAVSFLSSGREVLTAGNDCELILWKRLPRTDRLQSEIIGRHENSYIYDCAVDPAQRWAVSAAADNTLGIWSLGAVAEPRFLPGHTSHVVACEVSADGRYILSGSADKTVRVWSTGSWQTVLMLGGNEEAVMSVTFLANGKFAASTSGDGKVLIWELESLSRLLTPERPLALAPSMALVHPRPITVSA